MTKPNTTFNLDVKDLEIIEDALHSVIAKYSNDLVSVQNASDAGTTTRDRAADTARSRGTT